MRPASRTTMAWARCSASSMYWVVSSTVVPSATRSPMNCHRPFRVRGSRPVVGSSRNNTGGRLEVALVEVAQRVDDRLAESLEVGAPHRRVLAVDEREVLLAVVRSVGHRDLDVLALEVDDGIERLAGEVLLEEVLQPVLRPEGLSVQGEREPAVQERVVPEHVLDELRPEPQVRAEELRVGHELDHGPVALAGPRDAPVLPQPALREFDGLHLALPYGLGPVLDRERVHRLLARSEEH